MIYIPQQITNFTHSNIVETVLAFNPSTPYLEGSKCRVGTYHYISTYGTVALPNIGKEPLSNLGLAWIKLENEPSNTYACLDPYEETKTTWTGDGILEFLRETKTTLGIGNFQASKVTIEYRDNANNILETQTYDFLSNEYVFDEWDMLYADFSDSTSKVIFLPLSRVGTKIRIKFSRDGLSTYCGYLHAGKAVDMGMTLDGVSFPFTTIGTKRVKVANFNTVIENTRVLVKADEATALINEPMLFIIDESESSNHQNMVILGKIKQCSPDANVSTMNQISWQIEQTILE